MRCNTLFYAILLPGLAFAQSGVSGIGRPTGVAPGRNSTPEWNHSPHKHGNNHTHPLNGSSIEFNHTSSPSGAGFSQSLRMSHYTRPSRSPEPTTSTSGHLPYTKSAGAMFTNTTSGAAIQTSSGVFYPSGTGVSSGFAKPSGKGLCHLHSGNASKPISATEPPFSKSAGALFVNNTSAAGPTGTAMSSGFVQPTDYPHQSENSSKPTSATGRLPFSKSAGLVFTNSTSGAAGATGTAVSGYPSGTGISSGFANPTGFPNFTHPASSSKSPSGSTGRLPFSKSAGAMFTNTTSTSPASSTGIASGGLLPTAPQPTGYVPSGSVGTGLPLSTKSAEIIATSSGIVLSTSTFTTASGHPLYTKSAGAMFTNSSTTAPALSTGVFPTGVVPSGGLPTTFSTFASVPTAGSSNATSTTSALPSGTVIAQYYQCGGINWKGDGTCVKGTVCKYWNPYYSQCVSQE